MGFFHEHTRHDRDDYVTVQYENLPKDKKTKINFLKIQTATTFGLDYDAKSIMHYKKNDMSANGQSTIVPKVRIFEHKLRVAGWSDFFSALLTRPQEC